MDYKAKAAAFTEALERLGSVEAALREIDGKKRRRARRISDEEAAEIRRRRASGEKLASIGLDFGLNEGAVHYYCRGVEPSWRLVPHPQGLRILAIAGDLLGLPERWHVRDRIGRPSVAETTARWGAVLAMKHAGLCPRNIGATLGRAGAAAAAERLERRARAYGPARELSQRILGRLRQAAAQERSAA